jgi:hypothetical protein
LTNVRNPLTGQVHQEERPSEEIRERERPDLRIVDDDTFFKAQALLDENEARCAAVRPPRVNPKEKGRLVGSVAGGHRARHLLQGLITCAESGHTFMAKATGYLVCSGYRRGLCKIETGLHRPLAKRLILSAIGSRILDDPAWRQAVLDAATAAWDAKQAKVPDEIRRLEQSLAAVALKIRHLVDEIEKGVQDPEIRARLVARRREESELQRQVSGLRRKISASAPPPTAPWVDAKIQELHELLSGDHPGVAPVLRRLIGPVTVTEVQPSDRLRPYFRAAFRISAAAVAGVIAGDGDGPTEGGLLQEVTIDIREPSPAEERADQVKALYDEEWTNSVIAARLGLNLNQVRQALVAWYQQRGLPTPDNRSRRNARRAPDGWRPKYQVIAPDMMRLAAEGLLLHEIAKLLHCDRTTVKKAMEYWYASQGQTAPDGRARRKSVRLAREAERQSASPDNGGGDAGDGPDGLDASAA